MVDCRSSSAAMLVSRALLVSWWLLAVAGAIPVKHAPQPTAGLVQFGPPPEHQHQHQQVAAQPGGGAQDQLQLSAVPAVDVSERESSGALPTCPRRSLCVPAAQCSSAEVITYEPPKDVYHSASQYDQAFSPRYTCGQSAADHVCCREDGVLPHQGSSATGNPFGFPDDLGTGNFHFQDTANSAPGSASSGFGSDSSLGSSFSSVGSGSGAGVGSDFGPSSGSGTVSSSSPGSGTGFRSDSAFNSGIGGTTGSASSFGQESSGFQSDVGFGSSPSSGSGFSGSSTGSAAVFPGGSSGLSPGSNFFINSGFDVRPEAPPSSNLPSFGGMLPPGMPPLAPGMPLPGLGMSPHRPAMLPPGGALLPPPGGFPSSSAQFSPISPPSASSSSSGLSPGASGSSTATSGFSSGTSGFSSSSSSSPARRRLQQVLIRGQHHTLPEFSSVISLDGGAEAFVTHSATLVHMEVRPEPGFARSGRSQTVLVAGKPHITGEFVFVSDPSVPPIIVTTYGVPSQYNIVGAETADEIEPFVPRPELVMLAADIFRQIGGSVSQEGTSSPAGSVPPPPPPPPQPSFQPPPPASVPTSLRPPQDSDTPTGPDLFGGGQAGSFGGGQAGSFGGGQAGSFGGGQAGSFGGGQAGSFGGGQAGSFGGDPSLGVDQPGATFGGGRPDDFGGHSSGEVSSSDEDTYTFYDGESSHGGHAFGGGSHVSGHGHGPAPPHGHSRPHPYPPHRPPYHHRGPPPPYGLHPHGYRVHRPLPPPPPPHFHRPYLLQQVPTTLPVHAESCGLRGQLSAVYASVFGSYSARISSGFGLEPGVADYASHPWHAAVLLRTSPHDRRGQRLGGLRYLCGATLVSETALVTAAHCVQAEQESDLVIRLGEYNLYSGREELYKPYDAEVVAIHVHPDYRSSVYRADLAVLQLRSPVPLARLPHVTTACLTGPDLSGEPVTCEAPGWGYDAYKTQLEDAPHALKAVSVRPIPPAACEASLQATLLGPAFQLQKGSFCAAGSHGQDTCLGDGGGGLVCPRPSTSADDPPKYQLVGVTSWGVHCGDGTPGVYTRVASFRAWLETIIESSRHPAQVPPIAVPFL